MYEDEERVARIVSEAVHSLQNKMGLEESIRRVVGGLLELTEERLREEIRAAQEVILAEISRIARPPAGASGEESGEG